MKVTTEFQIVEVMIKMYCQKHHEVHDLCEDCWKLREYARERLKNCPFGNNKPKCSHCKIHCYNSEMQKKIREVMRFAGPRMILRHPIMAIRHVTNR